MSNTQHKSHNNCRKYQNIGHKQSESKIILPNMSLTESLMLTPEPFHPIIGIEHVASEGSDSTENILIIQFYTLLNVRIVDWNIFFYFFLIVWLIIF